MSERNAAAMTALARAAAPTLYAGQEDQINLHKLLDAAVDSTIRSSVYAAHATTSFTSLGPVLVDLAALGLAPELLGAQRFGFCLCQRRQLRRRGGGHADFSSPGRTRAVPCGVCRSYDHSTFPLRAIRRLCAPRPHGRRWLPPPRVARASETAPV
jgi:hypothetical protein